MQKFSDRSVNARITLSMDMAALTPSGATITSAEVTISIYAASSAPDPAPQNVLQDSCLLVGSIIRQVVAGGVVGATYVLDFVAIFSDGSRDVEQAYQTVAKYVPTL